MHAENYGAIWKHEWINFARSLTQDGSSLLNIQTNLSSALNIIGNISHRNILTRFRTSNHKFHIETGRYTRPITPVENRICSNCNSKSVEDELHFNNKWNALGGNEREITVLGKDKI
jgi:hypothetical protein